MDVRKEENQQDSEEIQSKAPGQKRVLIVGGSFSGIHAAKLLARKFRVTIIDQKDYIEYSPSIHQAFVNPKYYQNISTQISKTAKKIKVDFVLGQIIHISHDYAIFVDQENNKVNIQFDYCVVCSGSSYDSGIKAGQNSNTIGKRREEVFEISEQIQNSNNIAIVGGGFVGVEFASEIADAYKNQQVTLLTNKGSLLEGLSQKAQNEITRRLTLQPNLKVQYNIQVKSKEELNKEYDYVIHCTGNRYAAPFIKNVFRTSLDMHQRILVTPDQLVNYETNRTVFCVGDSCITKLNQPKLGLIGQMQASIAASNIEKLSQNPKSELSSIIAYPNMFAMTLGHNNAALIIDTFIICGVMAHVMKKLVEILKMNDLRGGVFGFQFFNLFHQVLLFFTAIFAATNQNQ